MKILQINSVCGYGSTGRIAADLMVDRIRRPNKDTDRIVLSPRLVERKSTIPYRETKRWQKPERPKEHS